MKKSELRKIIREEIQLLKEGEIVTMKKSELRKIIKEEMLKFDKWNDIINVGDGKGNTVAEFEFFGRVFVGSDYTHDKKNNEIKDIGNSYKIHDEFKPKDLLEMLEDWNENYSIRLTFDGYDFKTFKKKFKQKYGV